MIYRVFTTLLRFKLTRRLLLLTKKTKIIAKLVPMLEKWKNKDFIFQYPNTSVLGTNAISTLTQIINEAKVYKVLIVTDAFLAKTNVVQSVINELTNAKKHIEVFAGVKPNPSTDVVWDIVNQYKKTKCNTLLSIGGGSAHDALKAAWLCLSTGKMVKKLQGLDVSKVIKPIPTFIINTTAGTGSGCTNVAVITDEVTKFKMTLVDKNIQPKYVFNDANLMVDLPPKQSAWVGIDTLVHAIESYLSPIKNNLTDAYAIEAMRITYQYLPVVFNNPHNIKAREKMATAEFLAGLAFNHASLGFVHSMSHALSGVFDTPHGLANAILLPYVLDYELKNKKIMHSICQINDFMKVENLSIDDFNKACDFIKKIIALLQELKIPTNLKSICPNIRQHEINVMARKAMIDFCGITNPMQFSKRDVIKIYHNALNGQFVNVK